ncbi:MAG: hypothetical protein QM701_02765 [Propionivibrio sp.]
MISPKLNTPMAMTTKLMPSISSGMPKLKRGTAVITSVLIWPSSRPRTTMASALASEPEARTTAPTRPRNISAQYSGAPNSKASAVSGGAKAATTSVPKVPAKNEPRADTASAAPARPLRAIW